MTRCRSTILSGSLTASFRQHRSSDSAASTIIDKRPKQSRRNTMPFPDKVRLQALLWCDRHCCLCKKACDIHIALHHLNPESEGGSNDIDNAMPLCFDCHAKVEHYNNQHPRGTKYNIKELKERREQVYEEFTRHLVPSVGHQIIPIVQRNRALGESHSPAGGHEAKPTDAVNPSKAPAMPTVLENSMGPAFAGMTRKRRWRTQRLPNTPSQNAMGITGQKTDKISISRFRFVNCGIAALRT